MHAWSGSLFFWRDRTREVDFVVNIRRTLSLFDAKWTELASPADAVNLEFVRKVVGKHRVMSGAIVARARNAFPLSTGLRVLSVADLA